MWILALDTLTWSPVSGPAKSAPPTPSQNGDAAADILAPVPQPLPPCAGHAMVAWGSKLLVLGGHMKVLHTPLYAACSQDTGFFLFSKFTVLGCSGGHMRVHTA